MSQRISLDWIACDGRGLCAELLPERIAMDEWGYPLLDATPLSADLDAHARRAVRACPTRALRVQHVPAGAAGGPAPASQPLPAGRRQAGTAPHASVARGAARTQRTR